MTDVYLLLGSNLGDREGFLERAAAELEKEVGQLVKRSSVYLTQAWGKTDEPDYLNQVVLLRTALAARTVLQKILSIELSMGRKRAEKWGSRIIDIDILLYGNEIIREEGLVVPHPEMHRRSFVLQPLAEIAPQVLHPVTGQNIFTLNAELKTGLLVKKL